MRHRLWLTDNRSCTVRSMPRRTAAVRTNVAVRRSSSERISRAPHRMQGSQRTFAAHRGHQRNTLVGYRRGDSGQAVAPRRLCCRGTAVDARRPVTGRHTSIVGLPKIDRRVEAGAPRAVRNVGRARARDGHPRSSLGQRGIEHVAQLHREPPVTLGRGRPVDDPRRGIAASSPRRTRTTRPADD